MDVAAGERHALIGPNGAGKTTLFNLISGRFPITSGEIELDGERDRRVAAASHQPAGPVAQLPDHLDLSLGSGVREHPLQPAVEPRLPLFVLARCCGRQRALNEETERLLEELNLAERRDVPAGLLSYAEQRALEIGMTIAGGASMILLDEPTAGMSHSETEYAVALIRRVTQGKTLVMVEHDMRVVFDLADTITVLVYGQVIASGPPAEIRANRAVQEAYLGAMAA